MLWSSLSPARISTSAAITEFPRTYISMMSITTHVQVSDGTAIMSHHKSVTAKVRTIYFDWPKQKRRRYESSLCHKITFFACSCTVTMLIHIHSQTSAGHDFNTCIWRDIVKLLYFSTINHVKYLRLSQPRTKNALVFKRISHLTSTSWRCWFGFSWTRQYVLAWKRSAIKMGILRTYTERAI